MVSWFLQRPPIVVRILGSLGPQERLGLLPLNSADGYGNASHFNPAPELGQRNFTKFGEAVKSRSPLPGQHYRRSSGSSTSVVIGAAIAAMVLKIARDGDIEPEVYYRLHTSDGMGQVLSQLGQIRDGYCYVSPWRLGDWFGKKGAIKPVDRIRDLLL
jgi:hypothetical protein